MLKDLLMQRIELLGKTLQQLRPVGLQLLVQQLLGTRVVLDKRKAVALLLVPQSLLLHLARQPLATIYPHLHVERKPGLYAGIQPSQLRVFLVPVKHVTRSHATGDAGLDVFQGGARFHCADRTY